MNTRNIPETVIRRRGADTAYWQGACRDFSLLYEEIRLGSKDLTDVTPILQSMIKGEYPFGHHRNQSRALVTATGGIPSWQVIGTVVERVLGLEEIKGGDGHDVVRRTLCHRGRCLLHAEQDYRENLEVLDSLRLLGETASPLSCEVFSSPGALAKSCACDFHQNHSAVKGFKAKKRLLSILPGIVLELGNSLKLQA